VELAALAIPLALDEAARFELRDDIAGPVLRAFKNIREDRLWAPPKAGAEQTATTGMLFSAPGCCRYIGTGGEGMLRSMQDALNNFKLRRREHMQIKTFVLAVGWAHVQCALVG